MGAIYRGEMETSVDSGGYITAKLGLSAVSAVGESAEKILDVVRPTDSNRMPL